MSGLTFHVENFYWIAVRVLLVNFDCCSVLLLALEIKSTKIHYKLAQWRNYYNDFQKFCWFDGAL